MVGASALQLAYTLVDIYWVKSLGTDAIAVVAIAGAFLSYNYSISRLFAVGGGVSAAHALGQGNQREFSVYAINTLVAAVISSSLFLASVIIFNGPLISIYPLHSAKLIHMARLQLIVTAIPLVIFSMNRIFSSFFSAAGDTHTPLWVNAIAICINAALDPFFIFGYGPFPRLGVLGAPVATGIARIVAFVIMFILVSRRLKFFSAGLRSLSFKVIWHVIKLGLPIFAQALIFPTVGLTLGTIVAGFGAYALAAQKTGFLIETFFLMISDSIRSSLMSYVGQNFGGHKFHRIADGVRQFYPIGAIIGCVLGLMLVIFARPLFSIFAPKNDPRVLSVGIDYLKIIGISHCFAILEGMGAGIFGGIGKTKYLSIVSIIVTPLRIPLALLFCYPLKMGIDGVWLAIGLTSVIKGLIASGWLWVYFQPKYFGRALMRASRAVIAH